MYVLAHPWRYLFSEETIALVLVLTVFTLPAAAVTRLQDRVLLLSNAFPSATADYTVSFYYNSSVAVGSIDFLFCDNPIPYMPCDAPIGLDASAAALKSQTGEMGFSIASQSTNHIVLTRTPTAITPGGDKSSYTFSGITNPQVSGNAFSIRLKTLASSDGTGPQIDVGSVRSEVTTAITLEAQVPPMLIFCAARVVYDNCGGTDDHYYDDMGQLAPNNTLTTQSQMAVGTNASGGFAITAYGGPMAAGTNVIDSPVIPTVSIPGTNQFGINLVANDSPMVGADPDGIFANALAAPGYDQPNHYKYVPGDVIAYSANVSLMKKFTVSYIVNSSSSLRAGVYTTTINFIASGRF